MEDEVSLIQAEELLASCVSRLCPTPLPGCSAHHDRPEEGKLIPEDHNTNHLNGAVRILSKTPIPNPYTSKKEESGEYDVNLVSSWRGIYAQCLVSAAVFLLVTGCGMPIGYSAVLLPQLQGQNSSLPTDEDMGSWITSIHSAATPFGSFLSGVLADRFGRREAMRISILPITVGWALIAAAHYHWLILTGRFLVGFAVGLCAAPTQVMLGEIAEPRLRGILSGSLFVSYSLGILLIYGLGATLEWHIVAGLASILPLVSLLVLTLLPESPVWLARNNRTEEARKALYWLRGGPSTQAKREFQQMVSRIDADTIMTSQNEVANPGCWETFSKAEVLKPFLFVNCFNLLQVISGTFLVIFYAVDLISQTSEDSMDKFTAALLTALIRFLFCIVASVLLFYVGRRPMAITSGITSGLAALTLGAVLYAKTFKEYNLDEKTESLLIMTCLFTYIATNTCGFFVLPGITIGELLPVKVRGLAGGYIFTVFNIGLFTIAKLYPWLSNNLGASGMFFIFGGSTFAGTLFVYLFIPETKGKTLTQIEDYFKEDNIMWVTRDKRRSDLGYV